MPSSSSQPIHYVIGPQQSTMFIPQLYHKISRVLATYFLAWSQNLERIEQDRIFFGNPANRALEGVRAYVSPYYVTLSLVIMVIYWSRAALFVIFSLYHGKTSFADDASWTSFVLKAGIIYHESARLNMQITISLWTLSFILVYLAQYSLALLKLNFLAIFVMHPRGGITPKDMGVSMQAFKRIAYYRHRVFQLVHYNNLAISLNCFIFELSLTWYHGLFSVDFVYRFISCAFMFVFPMLAGSPEYGSPYYLYTLTYYLKEKQTKTLNELKSLNAQGHQLLRRLKSKSEATSILAVSQYRLVLFSNYLKLQAAMLRTCREAKDYADFWSYNLSIILTTYNTTIIYNCYLIFLNDLPMGFDLIYRLVFVTHVFLLIVIISSCCRVPIMIRQFGRECSHFHSFLHRANVFLSHERLKAENVTENMRQFEFGFRLWNGFLLNTTAYQTFIVNLGTFFFLFFRSNNVV